MAKSTSKRAKVTDTDIVEMRYTLAELSSSQHRAGLAGLVFMVDWLDRQPLDPRGVCEVTELDAHGATLRLDQLGLIQLLDQVYGASHEERRSSSAGEHREPLRIVEETIECQGETKTKTFYVYQVVVPRGAFLADPSWDSTVDDSGNGPWIKLWRDMVWNILRSRHTQRRPFNERADQIGSMDKVARDAWKALNHPEKSVELPSTYYLGAQAKTAENVVFKDRARFQFLLHFWPFVAQIDVPHFIDDNGKIHQLGFAIAVPDVADLQLFVEELPEALVARDGELRGYRPAHSLIDLSEESALALFVRLKQRLAQRQGEASTADLVLGVDVFHMDKKGKNVRVLGSGRVDPDEYLIDAYQRFRGQYWSPHFRRLRLSNMIAHRPWYKGFDRLCSTMSWKQTIDKKAFKHDARMAFEESNMSESESETTPATLEGIVYRMVGRYLERKVAIKHEGMSYATVKGDAAKTNAYRAAREKIARDAFLGARSRTGADFVEFFTSTICSTPQGMKRQDYELISRTLLDHSQIDDVRTLTLLALSARS